MKTRFAVGLILTLAGGLGAARADDTTPPTQTPPAKVAAAPKKDAKAPAAARGPAHDRLELDPTAITGSRELPKVLVIVPWKRADPGDLAGKPINSLVDEALSPLDRDKFRREVDYHSAISRDAAAARPPAGAPAGSANH